MEGKGEEKYGRETICWHLVWKLQLWPQNKYSTRTDIQALCRYSSHVGGVGYSLPAITHSLTYCFSWLLVSFTFFQFGDFWKNSLLQQHVHTTGPSPHLNDFSCIKIFFPCSFPPPFLHPSLPFIHVPGNGIARKVGCLLLVSQCLQEWINNEYFPMPSRKKKVSWHFWDQFDLLWIGMGEMNLCVWKSCSIKGTIFDDLSQLSCITQAVEFLLQ